jgi:hypothetical protein
MLLRRQFDASPFVREGDDMRGVCDGQVSGVFFLWNCFQAVLFQAVVFVSGLVACGCGVLVVLGGRFFVLSRAGLEMVGWMDFGKLSDNSLNGASFIMVASKSLSCCGGWVGQLAILQRGQKCRGIA